LVVALRQVAGILISAAVVFWVVVEALGVARIPDRRYDRTAATAIEDVTPVDTLEEGVFLDSLRASADVP
jgi:hypothetical protein